MNKEELRKVLEQHKEWWSGIGGKRAYLKGADLEGADLEGADLKGAYLEGADLGGAYLKGADLKRAYLKGANLKGADLKGANLKGANLKGADLKGANLKGAYLKGADLEGAYLKGADLGGADLKRAYLKGADLKGANLEFFSFPSLRLISSINLGEVSSELALELMRWDARCHPHPERFDEWSKGGDCPYITEDRFFFFLEKREDWKPGDPKLRGDELILKICEEKGWGIRGYLKGREKEENKEEGR